MSLLQIILISIWAGISGNYASDYLGFARPIVSGLVIGIILNDIALGVMLGATIEAMFLGLFTVGAALAPDHNLAGVIGVSLGISSGFGAEVAVAVALPAALLGQFLMTSIVYPGNLIFLHRADRYAKRNETRKIEWIFLLGGFILWFLKGFVPTFIALAFGAETVEIIFNALPEWIIDGFSIVAGILPAVGFAQLLNVLDTDRIMWGLLVLGFVLTSYLQLDMIAVTIISFVIVMLLDYTRSNVQGGEADG